MGRSVILLTFICSFALASCSDEEDGSSVVDALTSTSTTDSTSATGARTGIFVDSLVIGLSYSTGTYTSQTSSTGEFLYLPGEEVTFSIGNIVFGSAGGSDVLSPLDFDLGADTTDHPAIVNRLRLLQSLDNDADLTNGITISDTVRSVAGSVDIDFAQPISAFAGDLAVMNFLFDATGSTTLVSQTDADNHFATTITERNLNFTSLANRVYRAVLHLDPRVEIPTTFTDTLIIEGEDINIPRLGDTNQYRVGNIIVDGIRLTDLFSETGSQHGATPALNPSASEIAAALDSLEGISASAATQVLIEPTEATFGVTALSGLAINGEVIETSTTMSELAANIDSASVTAQLSSAQTHITLVQVDGEDLQFDGSLIGTNTLTISNGLNAAITLDNATNSLVTVGGTLTLAKVSGVNIENAFTARDNFWGPSLSDDNFSRSADNPFDAATSSTFNVSQSFSITDSFGFSHSAALYFVKEPLNDDDDATGGEPNTWSMYVEVDDQSVGGTDTEEPSQMRVILRFDELGDLTSEPRHMVGNWTPTYIPNDSAAPYGPNPDQSVIEDPPTSSNFEIDLSALRFGE